jgi:hypothetical protein
MTQDLLFITKPTVTTKKGSRLIRSNGTNNFKEERKR